jgi:hypothetical protein
MAISASELCHLAGELAAEHGMLARDYAQRAYRTLDCEGQHDRAEFWFALSVLVDDVLTHGLDPDAGPSIQ